MVGVVSTINKRKFLNKEIEEAFEENLFIKFIKFKGYVHKNLNHA